MKHIRLHNLRAHGLMCDLDLPKGDVAFVKRLASVLPPDEDKVLELPESRLKVSYSVLPNTDIPVVRKL